MDTLEIVAIAVPSGLAYLAIALPVARADYRSLDPQKATVGDAWMAFFVGLLWPIVLPLVGIFKFITALPKEKR